MEPTGHSDNDHRTPLRSNSPRAQPRNPNPSNTSPLRASKSRSPTHQTITSEDHSYEQRRQEELRRQIRMKEQELQQISSTKERFKNRIERTLGLTNSIPEFQAHQNKSPLRASITSQERQPSYRPQDRDHYTPMTEVNPRSNSPLRRHNKSQEREPVPFTTHGPRMLDRGANDYTNQLMADNQQLQRRLNLVVAELDRVTREKHLQEQRLQQAESETNGLRREIEDEDRTDKHLHGLQMEVSDMRENNKRAGLDIQRADTMRQESVHQLRMLQAERERRIQDCDEMRRNLQTKAQLLSQMDREQRLHQERIEDLNQQIAALQRQEHEDSHTLHDLDLVIARLNRERDELMGKLDSLNHNYDNTVAEISRERAQLESHNKRHSQLLTSKALGNLLHSMVLARKQAALNEFFSYCKFDEKCHTTLSAFVQVLNRCGHYQMKIGLKRWYQAAFKPIGTQTQSIMLAQKLHSSHTKQRMFQAWRQAIANQDSASGAQIRAVKQIWKLRMADAKKDLSRAFRIWRDQQCLGRQREKSLRYLIMRQYNCKRRQAIHKWALHSLDMGHAVRMHILAHSFTQDQLKLITFAQLRFRCAQHKRVRLMKLRRLFQGWRYSNAYRKFMMAQVVNTTQLRRTLNTNMMEACFAALRLNKETEKYDLMKEQLDQDMDPAIANLLQDIEAGSKAELKQRKQHALESLSRMATVKLGSYFYGWRDWKENHDVRVNKNLRQIITRLYHLKLAAAFHCWQMGRDHKARVRQQETLENLNENNRELTNDNVDLGQQIDREQQRQDRRARGGLTRGCNIFARRMQRYGLHRWMDQVRMLQRKEAGAETLIVKMRKKRERVAFDRYLAGVRLLRQDAKNEERAQFFAETVRMRNQRRVYNAWCVFVHKFTKSKQYWNIVLTKMDLWMKRRAFTNWQNQGNLKNQQFLEMEQNTQSDIFDELNSDLRNRQNRRADKSTKNEELKGQLNRQAERILANTYARMYYARLQRAFNKWEAVVDCQRHREDVIKRTEQHYKKHVMYFVRAAFHLWSQKEGVRELREEIAHTKMLGDEADQMNQHKRELFEQNKRALEAQTDETEREAEDLAQKGERTIALLIKKNDDNHYQSYRRYVFVQWATFVRKQKAFILAIEKVVSKSIQQDGFSNINAFARDKHITRQQNKSLVGMRRLFYRKTCGASFSKWKSWRLESSRINIMETNTMTDNLQDEHNQKVRKIRDWNCDRSSKAITRRNLHNLWQAWRNVTKWQKAARYARESHVEHQDHYLQIRAVRKWHERAEHTRKCRDRTEKFNAFRRKLILSAVYGALKDRFTIEKNLSWRLKELAHKFDHSHKQSAMQMIRNFANSRQYMHERQRNHATSDLVSALRHLVDRKRLEAISDFRTAFQNRKTKERLMSSVLGHWYSRSTREMFERWKKQAELCQVAIEVNEGGPVVEEVLKARQDLNNLQWFMREQGYAENEVKEVVDITKDKVKEQMARTRARWLAQGSEDHDAYLKPKMFDRWRQYVKIRKLVAYVLNLMENRMQPVKADLAVMFNRWKYTTGRSLDVMNGEERKSLQNKCAANVRKLGQLEDRTGETEDYLAHMGMQRDELIDNYMKSQKLAIALGRDNRQRGLAKGINQLQDHAHVKKRSNFEEMLQRNIDFIATLKDKIRQFEDDNQSLAGENEELRQFSLDGYQIAKNVQSLSSEREKLSVDLADKANTIKKLLDENEALSMNLREAQDNAQRLINQSQQNVRHMQPQLV